MHHPKIGLTEPSGLAVDEEASAFWIVSDETQVVFRLDANTGDIRAFTGRDSRMRDLAGVAVDADNKRLLMVSERTASIVTVSIEPPHRVSSIDLAELPGAKDLASALKDRGNGLEGIAIDPSTGTVFVLKEDAPRLLIALAPRLDRIMSLHDLDKVLPGDGDVSGLTVDPYRQGLWIVSDRNKAVHFLPFGGDAPLTFELYWRDKGRSRRLDNAEGVALSPDGQTLFVLTDDGKHSRLVQYRISVED